MMPSASPVMKPTCVLIYRCSPGSVIYPWEMHARFLFYLFAFASAGILKLTAEAPAPPNLVFFLVDDMGWQDTTVPFLYDEEGKPVVTPLNKRYHTPEMEKLAARGMKFTNAYAMSVCTPSRVAWITGKNSVRHQVTNWTHPEGNETTQNKIKSHRSPKDWRRGGLPEEFVTLPGLLRTAGYRTIHAGKAHFGATEYARDPLNIGFDVNIAGSSIGHPGSYSGDYGQKSNRPVPGMEAYHHSGIHLTDEIDGHDLTPYLQGQAGSHRPQEMLVHYPHDHRSEYFTTLRQGSWKLIHNYAPRGFELYHLGRDLSETNNLAKAEPERVSAMAGRMLEIIKESGGQWPVLAEDGSEDPIVVP